MMHSTAKGPRRRAASVEVFVVLIAFSHHAVGFVPGGAGINPAGSIACRSLISECGRFQAEPRLQKKQATGPGTNTVTATSLAPSKSKADKKSKHFKLWQKSGVVEFGSSQQVETPIPGASLASTKEYISDPSRIVYACWDHNSITPMGDGVFRMGLKGQRFLTISIDMSVDIKFWAGPNGSVQCKSVGYSLDDMSKILGQLFPENFSFELEGELRVEETETEVRGLALKNALLSGDVGLTIGGKMPGLLAATPERLVRTACLGINNRVLGYVLRKFVDTVAGDYRQWARNLNDKAAP